MFKYVYGRASWIGRRCSQPARALIVKTIDGESLTPARIERSLKLTVDFALRTPAASQGWHERRDRGGISITPELVIYALWGAWFVSWNVAALWTNRTEKRAGIVAEVFFRVFLGVGTILLFAFPSIRHHYYAQVRLWHPGDALKWILVALTFAGFLFAWWARVHLGRLWSDWGVTKKTGHHVVDTGPYRLVRHPIYSGLILAAFATAIEKGTSFALLGAAIITLAFYTKARREERFLRVELSEKAYDAYAGKTAMLIPFVGI